jgi:hypothetical protein
MLALTPPALLIMTMLLVIRLPGFCFEANGQPALPTFQGLGIYNRLPDQICGKQGVRWNPKELPRIGCFGLSSGSSASGIIDGLQLEVAVDSKGEESCKIDGTAAACDGCVNKGGRDCPTTLNVISRNSDKSIFLYFSRRVLGRAYFVTNQENWDYELASARAPEWTFCDKKGLGLKPN